MRDEQARLDRIAKILDELKDPLLPLEERHQLETELEQLGRVLEPLESRTVDPLFRPPIDMEAIHRRRNELDELFGLDHHDRP